MDFDFSAETVARARREDTLPPEPPKPAERSAWGWVPRITKAAVAGVAGSVADVVKGAAAADAMTLGADPRARAAFTDEQLQAGQAEGARQIATGEATTSDLGDSFRQVQKDARPDPVTAGQAERMVFGVAEPMLKLIGAGMTLGPFGLGAASAEMGMQQSDDLRQQGVDPLTRMTVGALTAGVTAASAALPMVGPSLKATAGLYLAGGPAGYMAQQAITSKILEHAGYDKIAAQFDPLDPVGLAMSALIPLPFAAHGAMRNFRAMKPAKGAAPAVDVPVKPEAPTVPRGAVDAAMVHNLTLQRDVQAARKPPTVALHGSDSDFSEFQVMPGRNPALFFSEAIDGGRKTQAEHIAGGPFGGVLYRVEIDAGKKFNPYDDPVAERIFTELFPGRATKTVEYTDIFIDSPLVTAMKENGYNRVRVYEPSVQGMSEAVLDPSLVRIIDKRDVRGGALQPETQPAAPTPKPDPAPAALFEAVAKAQEELAAFQASGKPLTEFVGGRNLPPEVNNLLIGLAETLKNPARAKALLDMVGKSDPKADPANVTADAVEAVRTLTDAELTNTPPDTIAAKPDALMQSVSDRVAAVEVANPDMVIGMTDSGNPITVRDELARIRREAMEGTDTTLGGADAELVNVAANCALTNGG